MTHRTKRHKPSAHQRRARKSGRDLAKMARNRRGSLNQTVDEFIASTAREVEAILNEEGATE